MSKQPLVVIVGPTAVGKTKISIEYAKIFDAEIISADSMQIYRGMDIGTAKIRKDEMQGIKHHLIDVVAPDQEFSVADFQRRARIIITEIIQRKHLPLMVGGTGLYINSIVDNFDFTEIETDWEFRHNLQKIAEEKGNAYLHRQLQMVDPETAAKVHENDRRRVIRALEVYHKTGKPISHYQAISRLQPSPYRLLMFGLTMPRDLLYQRVEARIEKMLADGLVDEVRRLLAEGYDPSLVSMQGLGYKEIAGFLLGKSSYEEAVALLKKNTRHFVKRQLTWFRRDQRIIWLDLTKEPVLETMCNKTREFLENS